MAGADTKDTPKRRGRPLKKPAKKTDPLNRKIVHVTGSEISEAVTEESLSDAPVVHRRVVAVEASQVTPVLAKKIVSEGSDYCCRIENNNRSLYKKIVSLFDEISDDDPKMLISKQISENSSAITESTVRILPGTLLSNALQKRWSGINIGCIAKMSTIEDYKSSKNHIEDIKYFITTLDYDYQFIAEDFGDLLRNKWYGQSNQNKIPNFEQDLFEEQDIDDSLYENEYYLRGVERMKKITSHVVDVLTKMESEKENRQISREEMQEKISDIGTFLRLFREAAEKKLLFLPETFSFD